MKICLHGAYYSTNFGDILLHQILVRWIRDLDPAIHINLPDCPKWNLREIGADSVGWKNAADTQALVYAGGGYLGEPTGDVAAWTQRNHARYIRPGLEAIERGLPIALIGVGVGPVRDKTFRKDLLRIMGHARVVSVRDRESKDFLCQYGANPASITVTADGALSLGVSDRFADSSSDTADRRARLASKAPGGQKFLAIHLHKGFSRETYGPLMNRLRVFLHEHPEWRAFALRDLQLPPWLWPWRQWRASARHRSGCPYSYPLLRHRSCDDLQRWIAAFDGIITSKLHVGIAATALGVPVISVPKHSKTTRFYAQIGRPERCRKPASFSDFALLPDDFTKTEDAAALREARRSSLTNRSFLEGFISGIPS